MTYLIQFKEWEYNKIRWRDSFIESIMKEIKEVYKVLKIERSI